MKKAFCSQSERFRYLYSAVQAAAAQVERIQDQVQGMPRVAERTVRRRNGAVRLQRREATWEVLNLRACTERSQKDRPSSASLSPSLGVHYPVQICAHKPDRLRCSKLACQKNTHHFRFIPQYHMRGLL